MSSIRCVSQKYLSRIADKKMDTALRTSGAVLIEGPKWCGKTRTAAEWAASTIYLQDIRKRKEYLQAAEIAPDILLKGDPPRLIDEWQTIPLLWDGVRFEVDQRGKPGQFILTGSAVPLDNATIHTGTGRFSRILLRPMTLFESLESNGEISLASLFNGDEIGGRSPLSVEKLAFALVRGGWPAAVIEGGTSSFQHVREYVDMVINADISRVDGVEKNPKRVRRLMRSLARNTSTMAGMKTIVDDIAGDEADGQISDTTIASYMNALRRIFVIEEQPAWGPSIRSKIAQRTSPKLHFVDPSIATAVLKISPEGLLRDFTTFGLFFESLCIRDLRVYAQALDGEVYHYRDGSDLEVDAIVSLYDGRWGAAEIKMGANKIDEAAECLIKFKNKVNTEKMGEPSFLMVLTATEFGYRRSDGVYVVPIGCLKD